MTYEMISAGLAANASSIMRSDPFEMSGASYSSYNKAMNLPYNPRPHTLTLAEQAELECELRYRGNMIVEQQRKIQVLEEELKRTRDQMELMSSQLSNYEQERLKEKKKPQSRYWTPEEHQRFLEALTKFGHKDVKAISMHVSTRNATQVRTHAQKYFLRLERERRKKPDGTPGKEGDLDGYGSSDMEDLSPDMGSPMDDNLSNPVLTRRKRASSFIITPAQAKLSGEHRDAVLSALPATWTNDDFDQFVKGLMANSDKQDMDVTHMCRAICENFLSHHSVDEVEICYRQLQKCVKQKSFSISSPKRRRANSKGEPPAYNAPSPPLNPFSSYVAGPSMNAFSSNASNNSHQLASLSLHQFHIAPTPTFSVSSSLTPASSANLQSSLARSTAPPPAPMMQIHDRRPLNMHLAPLSHEYGELPVLNHEVPMGHYNANLPSGFAFAFNPFHDAPGTSSTMVSSPN